MQQHVWAFGVVRVFWIIANCKLRSGHSEDKFINLLNSKYQCVLVNELKIVTSYGLLEINKYNKDELLERKIEFKPLSDNNGRRTFIKRTFSYLLRSLMQLNQEYAASNTCNSESLFT